MRLNAAFEERTEALSPQFCEFRPVYRLVPWPRMLRVNTARARDPFTSFNGSHTAVLGRKQQGNLLYTCLPATPGDGPRAREPGDRLGAPCLILASHGVGTYIIAEPRVIFRTGALRNSWEPDRAALETGQARQSMLGAERGPRRFAR